MTDVESFPNLKYISLQSGGMRGEYNYDALSSLRNVERINLRYCYIFKIDSTITTLPRLKRVDFYQCELENLPANFFSNENIFFYNLSVNHLKNIPDFPLKNRVKVLSVNKNYLRNLPASIANMDSLVSLNISENRFETFPKNALKLKSLKVLNISGNTMSSLPENIDELENLESLYLVNTKIVSFPKSFKKMPKLEIVVMNDKLLTADQKQNITSNLPSQCQIRWSEDVPLSNYEVTHKWE